MDKDKRLFGSRAICIFFSIALIVIIDTSIPKAENVISFGNIQLYPGRIVSINMYLSNSDTIAGFQVPISFQEIDINAVCDSANFGGGRCENFGLRHFEKFENERSIYILLLSNADTVSNNPFLAPGDGPICKLFFRLPEILNNKDFRLAKARIRKGPRDFRFLLWTSDATEVRGRIVPFERGIIK